MGRWLAFAVAAALVMSAAGCADSVQASSLNYLDRAQSSALIAVPVAQAANEVTALFIGQGFELIEHRVLSEKDGVVRLKYAYPGWEKLRLEIGHGAPETSVYYAYLAPQGDSAASLRLLGKPTFAAREPCHKQDTADLECVRVNVNARYAKLLLSGRPEAVMVLRILQELVAKQLVLVPPPPTVSETAAR